MLSVKFSMLILLIGLGDMESCVLRTRLADNPNVVFYYKGTAKDSNISLALNTIVAFSIEDATVFDKESACKLCTRLNSEKESLFAKGYTEFEVILL